MKEHFVSRDLVTLCTECFGDRNNPAILLIMGATASMLWWDQQFCKKLANEGHFVIRFDNRDVGKSTTFPAGTTPYELEDMVDDSIAILDSYRVRQAHLFGMSLGGLLCQITAIKYSDRVLSLILFATGPFGPSEPSIPAMDQRIVTFQQESAQIDWTDENAVVPYLVKGSQLLNGSGRQFNADRASTLAKAEFRRANNFRSMYNHAQLQGAESYFGLTNLIMQPCLIIHGTDDKIWDYRHASFLKKNLENSTLLTLEGAGHELHEADWVKIIAAVTQHIISITFRS